MIGPVDGGTELIITGMGFTNDSCTVRFSFGKGEDQFADAAGEYISPTEIKVVTPDFEEFGPKKVDVRLSMKGEAMTTTKTGYQFFENTTAANCVVYGPGTNPVCATGAPVAIIIQAVVSTHTDPPVVCNACRRLIGPHNLISGMLIGRDFALPVTTGRSGRDA